VVAIGELKTGQPDGDKLTIKAVVVGSSDDVAFQPQQGEQPVAIYDHLMPDAEARLQRQLGKMGEALAAKDVKTDEAIYEAKEQLYTGELSTLLKEARIGRFTCRHAGGGLILVAFRSRKSSLYNKVSKPVKINPNGFVGNFSQLVVKTYCASNYNSLIIGSLQYSRDSVPTLLTGTVPIFWWDIDLPLIKQIIFQETMALTIFNPAVLFAALEADGLTVTSFDPPDDFVLELTENNKKYTLVHFEYFVNLIRFALFTESHIRELISNLIRDMKAKQLQLNTKSVYKKPVFWQ